MDYRKFGETYYVRLDRGDEIVSCIFDVCKKEHIESCVFNGIGGCSSAEVQTYDPEKNEFNTRMIEGMLELITLMGNVISDDDGELYHHTHATFSMEEEGEHLMAAGHLKSSVVLYTAEIELRPVIGGAIKRKADPETGTGFWDLSK